MTQVLKAGLASIVSDYFLQAGSCFGADIECYYIWKVGHIILTLVFQKGQPDSSVVFIGIVLCRKAIGTERALVNSGELCLVRTQTLPNLSFPPGSSLWAQLAHLSISPLPLWLFICLYSWRWYHSLPFSFISPLSKCRLVSLTFLYVPAWSFQIKYKLHKNGNWVNLMGLTTISRACREGFWRATWWNTFLHPVFLGAWNCYFRAL